MMPPPDGGNRRSQGGPLRALAAALLALAAAALYAPAASAHAVLIDSDPIDRSVLPRAPAEIVLQFNEPVTPVVLRLLGADGAPVPLAPPEAIDTTVRVPLPAVLPSGAYLVSWRVTSSDSHPVGGTFMFAIGAEPASWRADLAPASRQSFWVAAVAANRALHLMALLLAVGAASYLFLVAPRASGGRPALAPLAVPAACLAAATAAVAIGLQGGAVADLPPAAFFHAEPWRIGAGTSRALASATAIVAMALLAVGLPRSDAAGRALTAIGAAGGLASIALSGHAASAHILWLYVPVLLLHVALAAFWSGSLAPLFRTLGRDGAAALPTVRRFSRAALAAVPLLLGAGVALALLQIGAWAALTGSDYGKLLLAKLALVAMLLALAGLNRLVLTPRLARGAPGGASALRFVIAVEIALVAAILCFTAALSQTAPPRTLAAAAASAHDHHDAMAPPFSAYVRSGNRAAVIEIAPAVAGRNAILVNIVDAEGRRVSPMEVGLELTNTARGLEPIVRKMTPTAGGGFSHVGPELSLPGPWTVRVDALISDFEKAVFETELTVRPAAADHLPPR